MERARRLANSGEVSSKHLVGFFKDECTNHLWRRAAGWLDWMGRDEPERQRAESQWIMAARPLFHLEYPVAYFSFLERILPAARWKLYFKAAATTLPPRQLSKRHVPLGAEAPSAAHGSFAPLAFQPSAMTNCVNQRFLSSKGSLGHAFTVRIRTGHQNQKSFYPSVPHEISVLVELILGHLRYLLTDVPPQPNSPPDNVFRPDRPAQRALGPKRESSSTGSSFPADSAKPVPLAVVSLDSRQLAVRRAGKAPEGTVPSPSPGRHAATRSRRGSSSSSPPTADGFGTGTPVPSPQSQSFSQTYGSILPTSLAYIVPSTRGCSPWKPDAVMSTTGCGRHSVLLIFKGLGERTGCHAMCGALPAAGPYLRLSRFQGGRAVKQKR
ncbi:Regulator of rDNA transcription protein 15 [Capsicum baccatum]|uniref:Regulator of rDNA transcription protein 15 n=1 Tax=Capsicum baccatum TaxID=33114 RepID=A0A2G2UZB1_CAPBA|nr:Regulator of rDNA transcription protein 15 [Capsicum baccatum]